MDGQRNKDFRASLYAFFTQTRRMHSGTFIHKQSIVLEIGRESFTGRDTHAFAERFACFRPMHQEN
jgi:hypothetical protein